MSRAYLYAIVGQPPEGPLGHGLRDEPLWLVDAGPVVAVVGEMDESPAATADAVRGHDAVVRRLAGISDAILPARFGAVQEPATLREWLASASAGLVAALALVAGREQMTLHVFDDDTGAAQPRFTGAAQPRDTRAAEPHAEAPPGEEPADESSLGPGARYLAERRRRWQTDRLPELAPLRARLDPLVRAERVEPRAAPPLRASVYHLVERGRGADYRETIESNLALVSGLRLRVSGPWAPYAFAPDPAPVPS